MNLTLTLPLVFVRPQVRCRFEVLQGVSTSFTCTSLQELANQLSQAASAALTPNAASASQPLPAAAAYFPLTGGLAIHT